MFFKKELRELWPFYINSFLISLFAIATPFYAVYFKGIGLSLPQIGILLMTIPITALLFEVPTGVFADLYGRKLSVILGFIGQGFVLLWIFFATNFYFLFFLFILQGIFATFCSGSWEAWVYDLSKSKKLNVTNSLFSKITSINNFGFILSGLLGTLLVSIFGLGVIWLVMGFGVLFSTALLFIPPEKYGKQEFNIDKTLSGFYRQNKKSLTFCYRHKTILYLLIIDFLFFIVYSFDSMFYISWNSFLDEFDFPESSWGFLWSIMGFMGIISPMIASKISRDKEKKFLIISCIAILFYGIIALIAQNLFFAFALVIFGGFMLDFRNPLALTYFHTFVPSKMRATIGSVRSMIISIAIILALLLHGLLVEKIGGKYLMFLSGIFMIPIIILYRKIRGQK